MADSFVERMRKSSHLSGGNAAYLESLYESFLNDPGAIAEQWSDYFDGLPRQRQVPDVPHSAIIEHFGRLGRNRLRARPERVSAAITDEHATKQVRVLELIAAYRNRGHRRARLDPLGVWRRADAPELDLVYHGLSLADLDTVFQTGSAHFFDVGTASLRDIVDALERTYCSAIGVEYMHISDAAEQLWVCRRVEAARSNAALDAAEKLVVLERLTAAEGLEKYLHAKYPGTKRFSLEGSDSLIPMLHETLQRTGAHGVVETVIGMAHRGRLNVLVNIFGKHPGDLFDEFEGRLAETAAMGDVKYHQGFSSNVETAGGEMHVALAFNPSHLEIVGPVVEGSVRARQDRRRDPAGDRVVPIVIHGDAAFAGQGVVMETFQMSQTRGYRTGGTLHIIVNNQIGFTTHRIDDARSTEYCSEVAKLVRAPIFHVNADDPEAVIFVTRLAVDYRMQFKKDVVIDLVCYRRRGHNEAEEPMKTQPLMYQAIRQHPTTRAIYATRLAEEGAVGSGEADALAEDYRTSLDSGDHVARSLVHEPDAELFVDWRPYLGHEWTTPADTRVDLARLQELARRVNTVPDGFALHTQVQRLLDDRKRMGAGAAPINWGFAETMAYATLLDQGHAVRLTGQDVGVGTFSHRHAVLYNQKSGDSHVPLQHLHGTSASGERERPAELGPWSTSGAGPGAFSRGARGGTPRMQEPKPKAPPVGHLLESADAPTIEVYDSLLSEEAVLAFEYGYATTTPGALIVWEAQFGDFANGAQVVIDQFITSGETKWARLCGLVMLLPHGYEGQGPEHSSARLERYLQLCAEHNIQVCLPTTPAQMFHMLRRQVMRPLRKPLVALTPKSLLRHKLAVSSLEDLTDGSFRNVIPEVDDLDPQGVKRLVLCSGKVFYELLEERRERNLDDVAIVRIEQLYPFPEQELGEVIAPYKNLKYVTWCQEEPANQGAWYSSQHHMRRVLARHDVSLYLFYAGRVGFASPASGYFSKHIDRQKRLVEEALIG